MYNWADLDGDASYLCCTCIFQVSSLHSVAASGKLDDVKRLLTADAKLINSRDEKQVRLKSLMPFVVMCECSCFSRNV